MSEWLAGMPPAPPPAALRPAAVAVLYRRVGSRVEVFWVLREKTLAFAAGMYAFPGGKVDKGDRGVPVRGATGEAAALRAAAARELLEETGVLVAEGAERLSAEQVRALRRALLEEKRPWAELLAEAGLSLSAEPFREAGRWVTPEYSPVRFDAHFFLVECPAQAHAEAWPGELAEGAWVSPAEALARWEEGSALLLAPNLHALRVLAAWDSEASVLARMASPPYCRDYIARRVEVQQGVMVFPLRTATLPPATHTNAYVLGTGELLVVDPGAEDETECERLVAFLRELQAEGCRLQAVVLTHHHGDHTGGVGYLRQALGLPVWCHARTADRLPVPTERLLEEGEVLELAGSPAQRWRVLHTPGHARGHICLVEERSRAAVVGDMVSSLSTIVIDPPEGDMGDYLAQLRRLKELPVGALYPAHGPVVPEGPGKLEEYLRHRAAREALILAALPPEGATLPQVVERAYADTPPFLHPVAERSALATLLKLVAEHRVHSQGERFLPAGNPF